MIEDASKWRLIKIIKSLLDSIHTENWAASSNVLLLMFLPQDQNKSKKFDRIRSMPWKRLNHFIVGCQICIINEGLVWLLPSYLLSSLGTLRYIFLFWLLLFWLSHSFSVTHHFCLRDQVSFIFPKPTCLGSLWAQSVFRDRHRQMQDEASLPL